MASLNNKAFHPGIFFILNRSTGKLEPVPGDSESEGHAGKVFSLSKGTNAHPFTLSYSLEI